MKKLHKVHMLPTELNINETDLKGLLYLDSKGNPKQYPVGNKPADGFIPKFQHLYFTSDEEIKQGDWYIDDCNQVRQSITSDKEYWAVRLDYRKIVATTDKSLTLSFPKVTDKDSWWCGKNATNPFISMQDARHYYFKNSVPLIPQQFIEEYVKAGGIDEVLLEYDWVGARCVLCGFDKDSNECINRADCPKKYFGGKEILKTDQNNCVIIHTAEPKLYTREEVISLLNDFGNHVAMCHIDCQMELDIKENDWIKENLK